MLILSVFPFEIKHYTDQADGDESQHNSHDNDGCRCSGSTLICKSISVVDVKFFFYIIICKFSMSRSNINNINIHA